MSSSDVPDAILDDERLSDAELGILLYLWARFRRARISQGAVRARFCCGREGVRARFAELQALDYLRRVHPRDPATQLFLGDFYVLVDPLPNEPRAAADSGAS